MPDNIAITLTIQKFLVIHVPSQSQQHNMKTFSSDFNIYASSYVCVVLAFIFKLLFITLIQKMCNEGQMWTHIWRKPWFCPTDVCCPVVLINLHPVKENMGERTKRRSAEMETEVDNEDQSIKMHNEGLKNKKGRKAYLASSHFPLPTIWSLFPSFLFGTPIQLLWSGLNRQLAAHSLTERQGKKEIQSSVEH